MPSTPSLREALQDWMSSYDGFSQSELERRCDPATLKRIAKSRSALSQDDGGWQPTLDDEELETILVIARNRQSGRITEYMSMVERVAKAAWEFEHPSFPRHSRGWADEDEETRLYYLKKARHDIAVMAEPTEAMVRLTADPGPGTSGGQLEPNLEVLRLREALSWYGEQARLARLIHSEGDAGRNALAADGGKLARTALSTKTEGET